MKKTAQILIGLAAGMCAVSAFAQADKPNILVVWGDETGQSNISQYTRGIMGYKTPAGDYVVSFLATLEEYPPRQKPGSFTMVDLKEQIYRNVGAH